MEITFSNKLFSHQKVIFSEHLGVLIGKHSSGKTTILNSLEAGLKGKENNFFVNNQSVKPGDYQTIYIKDHFNLKEEIKLTKSSPFRNQILKTINYHILEKNQYQDITEKIQKLALAVEKTITELFAKNLKAITDENVILKFGTEKINLENIIDHLLSIDLFDQKKGLFLDRTTFNKFLLRMVVFSVLQNSVDQTDQQRPIFILFDNPELYTNLNTMIQLIEILKKLLKKPNFFLLLASNSIDFLLHFQVEAKHINWVKNHQVVQILEPHQVIKQATTFYHFLKNPAYKDWFLYQNDFAKIFTNKDLLLENQKFYENHAKIFFHFFFLDKIIINIDKFQNNLLPKITFANNQYTAFFNQNRKGAIFLSVFAQKLGIPLFFSEKTIKNYPQIMFFFKNQIKNS